jgi:putative endopeptidase
MTRTKSLFGLSSLFLLAACGSSSTPTPTPLPKEAPVATAQPVETAKPVETAPPVQPVVLSTYQGKPRLGTFGVDMDGMDTSVKPGADFYKYAGGTWIKKNPIPADRARWGTFDALREESDANVRKILDEQAAKKPKKGTSAQKATDMYAAYLDVAAIDKKGFAPAKKLLDVIAAAKNTDDIAKLMGRPDLPTRSPIAMSVSLDQKNPDRYVISVTQAGLGLPEREYYFKTDKDFQEIREKYEAHIGKVLAMVGDKKAAADAKEILALETKIAEVHWKIADRRDRDKTYNARTIAELEKEAPKFPWKVFMKAQGFDKETSVVVREVTAMPKLAEIFASTPVETWKAYMTYHFLRSSADVLPTALDKEVFDFTGRILSGQPEQRERWKRGVGEVNGALGDAVGELYVALHFQPKAKAAMDALVENLRKGYASRIQKVEWMTPETKKVALEKLAAFRPKIGYPSKWKSYATLDVVAGDAFGNARRAEVWQQADERSRLGKPTDREEWFMAPQVVNAYYNATFNEIVFPAAILQPPFFDAEAEAAVNYGAIGGVIGHEMGHGFDDQGAKSDAKGVLRTWWAPADVEAFKKRTDVLVEQYAAFEPLPGIKVNGKLTLGENIGDIGGITVAHEAYMLSLEGKPAGMLGGYTGDQRFFFGWAQVWRSLYRDEALRNQVLSDSHSPSMYRVNGVLRNVDAWYEAFGIKEGDALYLAPDKRVKIW